MNDNDGNKQLGMLPETPSGGGVRILGKLFQDAVLSFINACRLTKFTIQLKDGSTVGRVIQADIKSTALGGTQVTIPLEISAAGSASLELTDGTTDLTGVSKITVSGATVGGTAAAATLTVAGWNFPTAIKYDSTKTYSKGQVVFVDPANSALGQAQAWPGIWVATQAVPVPSAEKHYPNVQNIADGSGNPVKFDDSNNYWMPVGLNRFQFRISTLSNADYYKAKLWDGTTLSSVEFTIAKPNRLRPSVASEVIDGVTVSYSSYTSDNTRTASDGTNTEYQVAFPRFISGSVDTAVITASLVLNGTGVSVSSKMIFMEEDQPSRVWARRYVQ